jgi:ATP/maltotriose-dependent transcriptional regulator MalT/DNA-binding SARP family transcriptional activator
MHASAANPIDTHRGDFLSFAPPLGEQRSGMEEVRVSVERAIDDRMAEEMALVRSGFPLRSAKVQRPVLPDETLRRDRLFDWLDARASRRVIYVIAEAGFGKTTLVADYLRRSQLRTFWYRLDDDDTDGLVFLRYLVAACQTVDSSLLPRSAALLTDSSMEPTREGAVLETLLTEIDGLGEMPSALVLDDFHMVEGVPAIGSLVERLISRAPAQLRMIVTSRRTPALSVASLRARGELAELGREELKFDESETCRFFRGSSHHPLEPEVLHELQARTDGWAASLQLIKTAVDGRSPGQVRAFVRSLSGAEGDLYDYLAEEVVGDLDPDLRDFLVRTSILEDVELDTAAIAAGVSHSRAKRLLSNAQRPGLMARVGDQGGAWRSHPLVREFLFAHLEAELGEDGVADLHRRLAAVMEPRSWRLAARHWAAAGDAAEVRRVVSAATPSIVGTGDLTAAEEFVTRFADPNPNPWYDIIRTRSLSASGRGQEALAEARRLHETYVIANAANRPVVLAIALTMLNVATEFGDRAMRATATDVLLACDDCELTSIARATEALHQAGGDGSLDDVRVALLETLRLNRERGHSRYEAVSLLNLSNTQSAMSNPRAVIASGTEALQILQSAGNCGDLAGAHINIAKGLAHVGLWEEARSHVERALAYPKESFSPEVFGEAAELEAMYGDPARGLLILDQVFLESERKLGDPYCRLVAARVALEHGRLRHASELIQQIEGGSLLPGFRSSRRSLELQVAATANPTDSDLPARLDSGICSAQKQHAWFWWKCMRLTQALISAGDRLSEHLRSLEPDDVAFLSIQAELVVGCLADLDYTALAIVRGEASLRSERWRWALRSLLDSDCHRQQDMRRAAELLEIVGGPEDVGRLVSLRKRRALHLPDAGRALRRRLAPRVFVEDLGRVEVHVGDRVVVGTDIRKKVLSLLCFLLTRHQFTAARDQVLDALWPEMDPVAATNSLNQSAYFLRRVLEPEYEDDTSAGYLRSRADLIWLDQELVHCRSTDCLKLLGAIRRDPSPELVGRLAETYTGRFAVEFIYDDWASTFRDTLHASFLDRVERAVTGDTNAGAFDRALRVAQLALQADPDAEQLELCLLRLYRRTGANAAAAEQYAHYATVMREQLGVEPPPLESI